MEEFKINVLNFEELDKLTSLLAKIRGITLQEEHLIHSEMLDKGSRIMHPVPLSVILANDEFKEYHNQANDVLNRASMLIASNAELKKLFNIK